jgi:hypothetical protein
VAEIFVRSYREIIAKGAPTEADSLAGVIPSNSAAQSLVEIGMSDEKGIFEHWLNISKAVFTYARIRFWRMALSSAPIASFQPLHQAIASPLEE